MIEYMIAIDAGGTNTKIYAISKTKEILASVLAGVGSAAVVSEMEVFKNITSGLDEIIQKIDHQKYKLAFIQMGLSAFSIIDDAKKREEEFAKRYNTEVSISSDTVIALYSILQDKYKKGVVIVSGTGVAVYGENKEKSALIGGWGHIIRELGSGYACIHHFALSIIDDLEESIPLTPFKEGFLDLLKEQNISDLKHLFYGHSKRKIASFVPYVKTWAKNGCDEAKRLLFCEGYDLGYQVYKAIKKLKLEKDYVIGLRGGFVQYQNEEIIEGIKTFLKEKKIYEQIISDEVEPIIGAYFLAKKKGKI